MTAVPVSVPPPASRPLPPDNGGHRFQHVDSLRAVAALLVAWVHISEVFWPITAHNPPWTDILYTLPRRLSFGRLGVVLFFAVSGFVICRSLERDGTRGRLAATRRFLIKRFCRLYPAFWVSVAVGIVIWLLQGQPLTGRMVAANVAMLPGFLGQAPFFGLYWTLETELVFYGLCLLLFWGGTLHRPWVLFVLSLCLSGLPRASHNVEALLHLHPWLDPRRSELCYNLAVMFWGAYFRELYGATEGFRQHLWRERWAMLMLAAATLWISLVPDKHLTWYLLGLWHGKTPTYFPYPLALIGFIVWVAWWRIRLPPLVYLGVISYSLYLFHPTAFFLILAVVGEGEGSLAAKTPLWLAVLVTGGVAVGLAAIVYRWVERPSMLLAKRWENAGRGKEPAV